MPESSRSVANVMAHQHVHSPEGRGLQSTAARSSWAPSRILARMLRRRGYQQVVVDDGDWIAERERTEDQPALRQARVVQVEHFLAVDIDDVLGAERPHDDVVDLIAGAHRADSP